MNINIRAEGGTGDHLLANRFVPAILDAYPNASIKMYSDTEGNTKSANLLTNLFGRFYDRGIEIIVERANKEFKIKSQFGEENYPAHLDNQHPNVLSRMLDCDKFYDFHIDGLKWLDYKELGLLNYFSHFPKPDLKDTVLTSLPELSIPFILVHLMSRPDSDHKLEEWYVKRLLQKLSDTFVRVVVVCEKKNFGYYNFLKEEKSEITRGHSNVEVIDPSLEECFLIASKCSAFIGVDSGIRYIPMHFGKPTFVFSKYSREAGFAAESHVLRWLLNPKYALPNEFDAGSVVQRIKNAINNPFYPELHVDNVDRSIINRKWQTSK